MSDFTDSNGRHVAELNVGRLLAPTDDPRVADFMNNLDLINGMGQRMPGFVWMMSGSSEPGQGNTENNIGDDPQYVANLSVWESVSALETFVWGTLHRKFYERKAEWFEVMGKQHFVMWWVEPGHKPTLDEALERLEMLQRDGASDAAFGWDYARAQMHKTHACG